jgi:hypothetical protein
MDPLAEYQRVKHSFVTVLHAYVTAATLAHIGATSIDDAQGFVPNNIKSASRETQCEWLLQIIKPMVVKYCQLGCTDFHQRMQSLLIEPRQQYICRADGCGKPFVYRKCRDRHEQKKHGLDTELLEQENMLEAPEIVEGDGIYNYGCNVITLGLMLINCDDAIREGDGLRIRDMYKWWMLIWKKQESTKYSLASLHLQVQVTLSRQVL